MRSLKEIIKNTTASPTIVNPDSNFVVCTYWWGRGNMNQNTARPCVSFYEEITNYIKSQAISILQQGMKTEMPVKPILMPTFQNLEYIIITRDSTLSFLRKILLKYVNEASSVTAGIFDINKYVKNETTFEDKRDLLNCKIKVSGERYKKILGERGNDALNLENTIGFQSTLLLDVIRIMILYIHSMKKTLLNYAYVSYRASLLKATYEQTKDPSLKEEITKLAADFTKYSDELTKSVNVKRTYTAQANKKFSAKQVFSNFGTLRTEYPVSVPNGIDPNKSIPLWTELEFQNIQNKSIIQLLRERLQYFNAITYENMISNWEKACEKAGCNYMAIEYPDFAKPGGYQMAINAKPLFIKKALELCGKRNVLYIDGDMTINKYPHIFDMTDYDYMARGWWIDPRSSYKMDSSIMYDPYIFETSGGTMFFSQSNESKKLIDLWIQESEKPYNAGKADDRIISLIFNSRRLLLNMKVLQLPIEYLWLTLDYDDRMFELVDWDKDKTKQIRDSIFIEHPECLTSEDTATGAGASSNRTPKFYSFVGNENVLEPICELAHEAIMFPEKKYADGFRTYFDYMKATSYIDDGNPLLYQKKFVDKENPENNEYPLYITSFTERFGNKKRDYGDGELYSANEIVDINMRESQKISLDNLEITPINNTDVELRNERRVPEKEIIRGIIRLLREGKNVYYNPVHMPEYNPEFYRKIRTPLYSNLDFVFCPDILGVGYNYHAMFRPKIILGLPMFFRSGSNTLIQLLSMFLSFEELSEYIHNGTYEFLSKLRIAYVSKPKAMAPAPAPPAPKPGPVPNRVPMPVAARKVRDITHDWADDEYWSDSETPTPKKATLPAPPALVTARKQRDITHDWADDEYWSDSETPTPKKAALPPLVTGKKIRDITHDWADDEYWSDSEPPAPNAISGGNAQVQLGQYDYEDTLDFFYSSEREPVKSGGKGRRSYKKRESRKGRKQRASRKMRKTHKKV